MLIQKLLFSIKSTLPQKASLLNTLYRNIIQSLHSPPHQTLMLHKHSNCGYTAGLENS